MQSERQTIQTKRELCHGESTRNSRFVDTNVRGPKARVHLYYESTVPSAFSDLKYCLIMIVVFWFQVNSTF